MTSIKKIIFKPFIQMLKHVKTLLQRIKQIEQKLIETEIYVCELFNIKTFLISLTY